MFCQQGSPLHCTGNGMCAQMKHDLFCHYLDHIYPACSWQQPEARTMSWVAHPAFRDNMLLLQRLRILHDGALSINFALDTHITASPYKIAAIYYLW